MDCYPAGMLRDRHQVIRGRYLAEACTLHLCTATHQTNKQSTELKPPWMSSVNLFCFFLQKHLVHHNLSATRAKYYTRDKCEYKLFLVEPRGAKGMLRAANHFIPR